MIAGKMSLHSIYHIRSIYIITRQGSFEEHSQILSEVGCLLYMSLGTYRLQIDVHRLSESAWEQPIH